MFFLRVKRNFLLSCSFSQVSCEVLTKLCPKAYSTYIFNKSNNVFREEFFLKQNNFFQCSIKNRHNLECVRTYFNMKTSSWSLPKMQYTKYRIAKEWTSNTYYDDLFLSQPNKDDFAKSMKEIPIFLRFLKIICDLEKRPKHFIDFAKRCESGLLVEKDVYITKKELMDCIWKNGFSEAELNAYEISFPSEYHFHYPELAVLFDLHEEDCYKYCLKKRAANPIELVELKYQKPKNLLSSYGLCFLAVWFGLSNTVLSNAWFYSKTFPFAAVFYMLASYFYREIKEYIWKEEQILVDIAKDKKIQSENFLHDQMKKYSNGALCLTYLSSFKNDITSQLANYRNAQIRAQKEELVEKMTLKLIAIHNAEKSIQTSLQEIIVKEITSSFHSLFVSDTSMQDEAFQSAIKELSISENSNENNEEITHPVLKYFKNSLKELQEADLSVVRANKHGNVIERVAAVFQQKEKDFLDMFTVKYDEAQDVKKLLNKCKTKSNTYDFNLLDENEFKKLNQLYYTINERFGFAVPDESIITKQLKPMNEASADIFNDLNKNLSNTASMIRQKRLIAFAQAFE